MKKILLSLISLTLLCTYSYSQLPQLEWVKIIQAWGRPDISMIRCGGFSVDKQKNIYNIGLFRDSADFNPDTGVIHLETTTAYQDVYDDNYIQKLDSNGKFKWVIRFEPYDSIIFNQIVNDEAGNLFVTGKFYSDLVDLDPGPGYASFPSGGGYATSFIVKLDSGGNYLWGHIFGSNPTLVEMKIKKNNIYISGIYTQPFDADPTAYIHTMPAVNNTGAFIIKLDTSGSLKWSKVIDGVNPNPNLGHKLYIDEDENVYFTTATARQQTLDINPGPGVDYIYPTGEDAFIIKMDANASYKWGKHFRTGGTYELAVVLCLAADQDGNVYFGGYSSGKIDLDPGQDSAIEFKQEYFAKLKPDGSYFWHKTYDHITSTAGGHPYSITVDVYQNIYITGAIYGHVDLDFGPAIFDATGTSSTYRSRYFQKIDRDGNLKWAFVYLYNGGQDIYIDRSSLMTSASMRSWTDYDPDTGVYVVDPPGSSYFQTTVKLRLAETIEKHFDSSFCNYFTYQGINYYKSKTFVVNDTTSQGKDSATFYHFNVYPSYNATVTKTACDSFTYRDSTFYLSTSLTYNLTTVNGCDSIVILNLTINHSVDSTLSITGCDSVTVNDSTYYQTGTYYQYFTASNGCDSTLIINVTINKLQTAFITETACDSFQLNDSVYYTSGTYYQNFTAANGCDSIVTLNLTVNHSSSETLTETACFSFELNDSTYTESGIYTQLLKTTKGCDSILTLNLTINTVDTALKRNGPFWESSATNASFQWLDCEDEFSEVLGKTDSISTIDITGLYALEVTQNGCVDTTDCVNIIIGSVDRNNFPTSITAYPNPTSNEITIDLGSTYNNVTIEVHDAVGRRVRYMELKSAYEFPLTLDGTKGIYYITITNGNYTSKLKVVKQ